MYYLYKRTPFPSSPLRIHTRRLSVYLLKYSVISLVTAKFSVFLSCKNLKTLKKVLVYHWRGTTNFPDSWVFSFSKICPLKSKKTFEQLLREFPAMHVNQNLFLNSRINSKTQYLPTILSYFGSFVVLLSI